MRPFNIFLIFFSILFFYYFIYPIVIPPPPASDPAADWGDAPDPDQGMDTGYYAPFPSPTFPGVFIYDNVGIAAQFPTDNDGVQGPYAVDVDDFWIGPLANPPFFIFPGIGLLPGASAAGDIPSIELGVYDPADPDGPSNLETLPPSTTVDKADCDKENASHNPNQPSGFFGRICDPVPPYSIAMSGRLLIVVGNPPLAVFISRIWFSPTAELEEEGVYWNVLFDTNQDGEWGSSAAHREWVAQDEFVLFLPSVSSRMVVTPAFEWGSSGNPFGRLIFPVWARNMVSAESIADSVGLGLNDYEGQGPDGGFSKGEIEDYFVEWRPIGQILESESGAGQTDSNNQKADAENEGQMELLALFNGPDNAVVGEQIVLQPAGAELNGVGLVCVPEKSGVTSGAADIKPGDEGVSICADDSMSVSASWLDGNLVIDTEIAPTGSLLLVLGSTGNDLGSGVGHVTVHGGKIITLNNTN